MDIGEKESGLGGVDPRSVVPLCGSTGHHIETVLSFERVVEGEVIVPQVCEGFVRVLVTCCLLHGGRLVVIGVRDVVVEPHLGVVAESAFESQPLRECYLR